MTEVNNATETVNSAGAQRGQVLQEIAGVESRLEKKGIGAAFYRAARPDPIGDMGFLGSLFLHALVGVPLDGLMGDHLAAALGHGLDSALTLGAESASMLGETTKDRNPSRVKSAFYPLGRNNKKVVIEDRKTGKAASSAGRLSADVQADLSYLFELTDTLNKLDEKEAAEVNDKRLHLVTRKPAAVAYQGVERRRRPRPEGMFSA